MKKQIWIVIILGIAMAWVFTTVMAKQGGVQTSPVTVQEPYRIQEETIAATTVITMLHHETANGLASLEYQALLFETLHPDIDVKLLYSDDLFGSMQDPSNKFDLVTIDIVWPGEAYYKGWIMSLDDYIKNSTVISVSDFLSGTISAMTVNGHLVAVPWFTDAGLLYYRADLLSKYGYSIPQTFAELKTQALAIKSGEGLANGFVWQGGQYEGLTCDFLEYVWGSGGDILDPPYRVVLSSTQTVAALDIMIDYIHSGVSPAGVVTFNEEDARNLFQNGEAAFMRNWPYAWSFLQDNASPVKGKVGIAPMPHAPGEQSAATLGGWNLAISSHSSNPDAAFTFIEFLTDYDQQKYNALHQSVNPTRVTLYSDADICSANPFMCDLYDVFVNARPRPAVKEYNQFSWALIQEVHDALVGNKTSQQAIADAQQSLQLIAGAHLYMPVVLKK